MHARVRYPVWIFLTPQSLFGSSWEHGSNPPEREVGEKWAIPVEIRVTGQVDDNPTYQPLAAQLLKYE